MKKALFLAALLGLPAGAATAAPAAPEPRATVVFDHPEKFTDVKDGYFPSDKGRDGILRQIDEFVVHQADRILPAGYRLAITFTDIDLAGDFEPWHGPQWDNVRVVKAIYPPRFKFSYTVTGPGGEVVRQGQQDIRDMAFDMRASINTQDPLHFEKDFLGDWMRANLSHLKP